MRKITCLLLFLCLLPSFALADKTITLTFTGDITLGGEDYLRTAEDSFFAVYDREGAGYFLKNFADFFAEDDLTVVNLEGVLTDNNALYPRDKGKGDDGYWFRGPTEYAKVLSAASVEVASLANNHAFDYGAQGFRDTIAAVEAEGLGWFGTYNKNRDPKTEKFYFYTKDGVTICLMSLLWDDYNPQDPNGNGAYLRQQITEIKQSGQADAVIAILHGGQEYGRHRTKPQTIFTKMAISAGADLVICHHAHVVMGMDVINNRSAFYSLGNFCFGGNRNPSDKDTVIAQLTVSGTGGDRSWEMSYIPCCVSSVSNRNDYRPTPYPPDTAAYRRCFQKLDGTFRPPVPKPEAAETTPLPPEPTLDAEPLSPLPDGGVIGEPPAKPEEEYAKRAADAALFVLSAQVCIVDSGVTPPRFPASWPPQ